MMKKLLYFFLVTSIFLSSCSKNCPIPEAQEEWLFVHTAESAKILNTTTIVMPLVDDIFAFTDRPYRKSYHMTGATATDDVDGDLTSSIVTTGVVNTSIEGNYIITYTVSDTSGNTATATRQVAVVVQNLAIGQSYQGGIIAYIDSTGQHGLIAATADQSSGIQWYNGDYIVTGATGTAIGTGLTNTNAIIAAQGSGSYAASIARDYNGGGYTDWFLPSKDELNQLYVNRAAIGGFELTFTIGVLLRPMSLAGGAEFRQWNQTPDKDSSNVRAVRAF